MASKAIDWEYSDRPVSPFGGMRIMRDLMDQIGFDGILGAVDLPQPQSNRGYNPTDVIKGFIVSVWLGASRFAHTDMVRYDQVLPKIFGWTRFPSSVTFTRYFRKFDEKKNNEIFPALARSFFEKAKLPSRITLDVDSTVITRFGEQEGAAVGYNPARRGRASHHPLLAFISETRMAVNGWLRPGNTSSGNNTMAFLDETLVMLGETKVGLFRADSGFLRRDILEHLEEKSIPYVVAARMTKPIKFGIQDIRTWTTLADGISVAEFPYTISGSKTARRVVAIRQDIEKRPKASGKTLFPGLLLGPEYRYGAFVTNLDLPASSVSELYRGRADAENRIKELKYDFGMDSFNLNDFWATEAAFRFILMAYNIMSLFRQVVLSSKNQNTLATLKLKCFSIGSWIVKDGSRKVLKLSVTHSKRAWLDGLFSRARSLSPPFDIISPGKVVFGEG